MMLAEVVVMIGVFYVRLMGMVVGRFAAQLHKLHSGIVP